MRSEKLTVEKSLSEMEDSRTAMERQKDEERQQAVKQIQEQCDRDYRLFVDEHKDTLNKALKSARKQFDQEKVHDHPMYLQT